MVLECIRRQGQCRRMRARRGMQTTAVCVSASSSSEIQTPTTEGKERREEEREQGKSASFCCVYSVNTQRPFRAPMCRSYSSTQHTQCIVLQSLSAVAVARVFHSCVFHSSVWNPVLPSSLSLSLVLKRANLHSKGRGGGRGGDIGRWWVLEIKIPQRKRMCVLWRCDTKEGGGRYMYLGIEIHTTATQQPTTLATTPR